MNLFLRLLQRCFGCRHRHTYRERRTLYGAEVLHLVCENCGYAVPAIRRSAREHRQAAKLGAIKVAKAHRDPALIVAIETRRRVNKHKSHVTSYKSQVR